MPENRNEIGTPAKLRHDIDAGKGRDKIAYPDPAAAPLGTDDEAAGTPITKRQMQLARQNEIHDRSNPRSNKAVSTSPAGQKENSGNLSKTFSRKLGIWLALIFVVLLAVAAFTLRPLF